MLPGRVRRDSTLRRRLATALALFTVATAGARATVVVEGVQAPPGSTSSLVEGDRLLQWRSVGVDPQRSGEFRHWGELDLLPFLEGPRGTIEIQLVRGDRARTELVPSAAWTFRGRPADVDPALLALVASFAAATTELDPAGVERSLADASPAHRSWVLVRLAETAKRRSDWPSAEAAYAAAILNSPPELAADLERLLGEVYRRQGRLADAEAALERSRDRWNTIDPGGLGGSFALAGLGSLAAGRYEFAAAERFHLECARLRRQIAPRSWLHGNALNNLGTLAGRRNDLAAAERYLSESLAIAEAGQGDPAPPLANLGAVARLRGDFARAEMYTRRAIALLRGTGNDLEVANKLLNLGNLLGDQDRLEEALAAFSEALAILTTKASDNESLGTLYSNRAKVQQLSGNWKAAAEDLAVARETLGFELPRTGTEAQIVSLEAEQALATGDLAGAARSAGIALSARERIQPDSVLVAQAASALAAIRETQGHVADAERLYRQAIEALESQQNRLGGGDRGLVAFRAKHARIYLDLQEFLLRHRRGDEAFELFERSRAGALRALLQQRDLELPGSELAPAAARRRSEIGRDIDRRYLALARLPIADASEPERLEHRLAIEQLHAEEERLGREARAASPRVSAIEAPPFLKVDEIRRALGESELLLAYSLGSTSSTLFALDSRNGLSTHPIAAGEAGIAKEVRRWVELASGATVRPAELRAIEKRLTELLLSPVAKALATANRLLVVPDGMLHALAFSALPDPGHPDARLLERLPVSYQVSASVEVQLRRLERPSLAGPIAVFADPVGTRSAESRFRRSLGPLPASRREAARVREIFGERTRLFVDAKATEKAARRELESATMTHFATHAVVDELLPLDSALLLSPEDGAADELEGLLQAWEIAGQVSVASDLVVLSACETARGADRGGEGILGLVRALQVAGARSVVASLWRVDDDSTAELMGRFYAGLARGLPRDEALRQAQLELLRGPVRIVRDGRTVELRTSDPRHWAPFVLLGPAN